MHTIAIYNYFSCMLGECVCIIHMAGLLIMKNPSDSAVVIPEELLTLHLTSRLSSVARFNSRKVIVLLVVVVEPLFVV